MKTLKKIISATALTAMVFSAASAHADSECNGGVCYEESRRAPSIAPAIALGTVALIAIVAVAVQNSNDHKH